MRLGAHNGVSQYYHSTYLTWYREASLKAQRSRQSARECRRRKKAYLLMLERKVSLADSRIAELEETVKQLQEANQNLRKSLSAYAV